jgi:hypothetical protein
MTVYFDGRSLDTPQTASAVNDDAMQNRNLVGANNVAYIGTAEGGKPNTVLTFSSPEQARAVLRGGDMMKAVIKAFAPSPVTPAPAIVTALRVNPATQSTLTLQASSVDQIDLASVNYGAKDNSIRISIAAGSTVGKAITVQRMAETYTGDDIARDVMTVSYGGSEASATLTVNATSVVLKAPSATTIATILFADYPTVDALAEKINSYADFEAVILNDEYESETDDLFDFLTAADIKTASKTMTANLQAVVDWFNAGYQPLVAATRKANVGGVLTNISGVYMTGGAEGSTTNTEWTNGFTTLQSANVQWITPISSSSSIHAMADTHVKYCSTVLRRERRNICGTALSTSDASAIAAAKLLNSDRTSLCHIGHYEYNDAGVLELRPPYLTAAICSAALAGLSPGTPLTNKALSVKGWERDLEIPVDTDPLIRGGVLCVENAEDGFKVVQSISTWLANKKYNRVEQSCGAAIDFTVKSVRDAVDKLRGGKNNPLLLSQQLSTAESVLKELAKPEPIGPGVLVGDDASPAYRNITGTVEGDKTLIQFEASAAIPNNYVLITVYATAYTGTAAV